MTFALTPDGGPPRLIRFTSLDSGVVALLDTANNLLMIDKLRYQALSPTDRHNLLRMQCPEWGCKAA
jgi:hypothetical protein